MAIECKFCGGPHPFWDCRKAPDGWKPPQTKSTAARMDVPHEASHTASPDFSPETGKTLAKAAVKPGAGTQAPPVDTKSKRGRPRLANPTSPRAEYQRELMSKRRAAAKGANG